MRGGESNPLGEVGREVLKKKQMFTRGEAIAGTQEHWEGRRGEKKKTWRGFQGIQRKKGGVSSKKKKKLGQKSLYFPGDLRSDPVE